MQVAGKRALITGATGGIGEAIARKLNAHGASSLLTGRRSDRLATLAEELDATTTVCDLANRSELVKLAEEAADVDIVIANAGLPATGKLTSFSLEQIDRALDVNLRAPIVLARLIGEKMVDRGSGQIVFISSIAGKVSLGGSALYSATKFGLRGLAFGLREDLAPHGVGVSILFPGFIRDAGMFADAKVKLPPGVGTKTPEEVAEGVLRAIEHNRAETDVAAFSQRIGGVIGGVAPSLISAINRRLGGRDLSHQIAENQQGKR